MSINLSELEPRYVIAAAIAVLWGLFKAGPYIFSAIDKFVVFVRNNKNKLKAVVTFDRFAMAALAVVLLLPSSHKPDEDTQPEPEPVVVMDVADECWKNYRVMLADLLVEYNSKDLKMEDTRDDYLKQQELVYEAAFTPLNTRVDAAVFGNTVADLADKLKNGGVE